MSDDELRKWLIEIVALEKRILALLTPKIAVLAITNRKTKRTFNYPLKGVTKIMSAPILDDSLGYAYALAFVDADGNPAAAPSLPTPPAWSVTDTAGGTLATLTPAADGMSATVVPTGKGLGTVTVTCVVPAAAAPGTFAGATATDSFAIAADVATGVSLTATPITAAKK